MCQPLWRRRTVSAQFVSACVPRGHRLSCDDGGSCSMRPLWQAALQLWWQALRRVSGESANQRVYLRHHTLPPVSSTNGILAVASASGIHCSITTVANSSASPWQSPDEWSLWTLTATSSDGVVIISFVSSDFGAGPYSFVSSDFGVPTRRADPHGNDCD